MKTETFSGKALLVAGRAMAQNIAPYFASLFFALVVRESEAVPTIGVTDSGFLLWNPKFLDAVLASALAAKVDPVANVAFLWLHEAGHIFATHLKRKGARDARRFNEAGDLYINPVVRDMRGPKDRRALPLVGELKGLWPKDLGFPEGLTTDAYYDLLSKRAEAGGAGDGESEGAGGQKTKGVCGGDCGSCAGHESEGESSVKGDSAARTPSEIERAVKETAEAIRKASEKNAGSVPAALRILADEALTPAKVDWRARLAALARRAVAWRPGAVDYRYDAPSRRQACLGYGSGRPILPRLRMPVPRIAVPLDLSGSMFCDKSTIPTALSEIQGIVRSIESTAEFCTFDADVCDIVPVRNIQDVLKNLSGGGGTDFRPVFEAFEKRRPRIDLLIFVTDGWGPAPAVAPSWCRVIWCLVGPGSKAPVPWGEVVTVE